MVYLRKKLEVLSKRKWRRKMKRMLQVCLSKWTNHPSWFHAFKIITRASLKPDLSSSELSWRFNIWIPNIYICFSSCVIVSNCSNEKCSLFQKAIRKVLSGTDKWKVVMNTALDFNNPATKIWLQDKHAEDGVSISVKRLSRHWQENYLI